ncbi:hypothetical protein [Spartinivicinus ruber]|nr:hypothetical protein [Spartinivicinus ruber]
MIKDFRSSVLEFPFFGNNTQTQQLPTKVGGLALMTESPDTG